MVGVRVFLLVYLYFVKGFESKFLYLANGNRSRGKYVGSGDDRCTYGLRSTGKANHRSWNG